MSIECGECERDLRGGHDPSCSRYVPPPECPQCGKYLRQAVDDFGWDCQSCQTWFAIRPNRN